MSESDKPKSQSTMENTDSCKIFIIDDDERIGNLIQTKLNRLGYSSKWAKTGANALKIITGAKNELLLIDYKLPDMSGKELILKLQDKFGFTPEFITLTGYGNEKTAVEMMRLGSRDYIVKEQDFLEIVPHVVTRICKQLESKIKLEETEKQLKRSLELLKDTGEMARVGGWEIDLRTNKVYWSDFTKKIHEVPDDYFPELFVAVSFFPGGARNKIEKAVEKAMKKGKEYNMELPFITAKGNKLWVETRGIPQMENGKCVRLYGTLQDITRRKQAELEIKKKTAILIRTEQIAHVGSWDWDVETDTLTWSDEMFRIFKLDPKKGTPSRADQPNIYTPESIKQLNAAFQKCLNKGQSYQLDLEIIRGDGTNAFCTSIGFAKKDENGKVIQLFGSFQDITERKKKEEQLKKLNQELTASEKTNKELAFTLRERLKELKCLYSIASVIDRPGITIDAILQESVDFIPPGWQHPDKTFARITYRNKEYKTTPFRETKTSIKNTLVAGNKKQGTVEIFLTEKDSDGKKLTFLKEEKELLFLVTGRLSKVLDRYEITEQLQKSNQQLEALNQQLKSGEQQLRAANQQLTANEQQLRAANQQLEANEQQLRAANQQLVAGEAELRKSNETLKKYLDVAAEIVVLLGKDGKINLLNESGHRILGYKPGELIGKDWFSTCIPEEERIKVKQHLSKLKKDEIDGFNQFENKIITKSGEQKTILWHNNLFRDDKGNYAGILSSGEDFTERKKAEQKLIESEERFRKAQEAGHIGSWEFNLQTNEFWGSDEGKRIYNLDLNKKEFSAEEVMNIVVENDREKVNQAMIDLVTKNKLYDIIFEIIPKNTSERKIIRSIAELQKDETGKPLKVTGVLHDITLQKKTEAQLIKAKEKAEEADQLKSAFLANMSHEIRTPMNGILGFTDLLKDPNLSDERQLKFIEIIQKSGNRMLETVNALIDISKIETGQVVVNTEKVDINQEVQSLFDFFVAEAKQKGLTFDLDNQLPDEISRIHTDKSKLISIMTNLIKNAIKYTDEGYINVGLKRRGDNLHFYVKDSGIGVPKNRQKAIFNRFEQADINDTRAFQGSGLGLAIAKAYVEMLGGEIGVESEEGCGSVFWFSLPHISDLNTQETDNGKKLNAVNNKSRKLKVVVAEDDELSAEYLSALLKTEVREILFATSGKQTVELCKKHTDADLVLMDIKMPEGNGYESLKEIRKFNSKIKIIAQTANALAGDREKALDAGFDDYVSKPIRKQDLITKINNLFY